MAAEIPFKSDRFRSAAPHYLSGRPSYAPLLIRRVAARADELAQKLREPMAPFAQAGLVTELVE